MNLNNMILKMLPFDQLSTPPKLGLTCVKHIFYYKLNIRTHIDSFVLELFYFLMEEKLLFDSDINPMEPKYMTYILLQNADFRKL